MKNFPTLTEDGGGKPEKMKQEKSLRLFCSLDGGDNGFNKLTTFLCWSHRGLVISGVMGLAINEAVLTGTDVIVNFFGLSLW